MLDSEYELFGYLRLTLPHLNVYFTFLNVSISWRGWAQTDRHEWYLDIIILNASQVSFFGHDRYQTIFSRLYYSQYYSSILSFFERFAIFWSSVRYQFLIAPPTTNARRRSSADVEALTTAVCAEFILRRSLRILTVCAPWWHSFAFVAARGSCAAGRAPAAMESKAKAVDEMTTTEIRQELKRQVHFVRDFSASRVCARR